MQTYVGTKREFHAKVTAVLGAAEWSASKTGRFDLQERAPGIR